MSRSAYPGFRCANWQANPEDDLPAREESDADVVCADGRAEDVEDVEDVDVDDIPDSLDLNAETALESQEQRIRFHRSCRPVAALPKSDSAVALRRKRKLSAKCRLSSKVAASSFKAFVVACGQAQASLRASLGEAAQRLTQKQPFAVEEAVIESPDAGTSFAFQGCEGLSASWMKEFEAASAVSQPGRATAEVLIDNLNLDHLDYLSRRSSGHCMVIREGQGDFLGQIGAMKDPSAVEATEIETEGRESEESSEEVLEERAPETRPEESQNAHPDEIQAEAAEAEITQPAAKELPEADDDSGDLQREVPHELQAEHIEAAMATLPGLSEEREMDLDL
eukprot:s162_g28.t1